MMTAKQSSSYYEDKMYNGLSTEDKKSLFLLALKELDGNITKACEVAGVSSRQTFYNWMESDDDFKVAVRSIELEVKDVLLDQAEHVVRYWLLKADKDMAKWLLGRLGRNRGYGNKIDVGMIGEGFKGLEYPAEPQDLATWERAQQADSAPTV
jgi:hypothetical protein